MSRAAPLRRHKPKGVPPKLVPTRACYYCDGTGRRETCCSGIGMQATMCCSVPDLVTCPDCQGTGRVARDVEPEEHKQHG